ncbi:hypothetical protein [Ectopseudomonas oleovorans]|uniref:Uncharacterized protein n=1 Tax=Ectopseudomonas oleovorans TaxID=301 RepID=A0AA42QDK3_ECTOL|nr:hypothetical protein [Pseudomonas oleovorans]MDH1341859.1 hypothetical protein [Pseudomonas oleovorans]MDH1490855.1 hypothetical protein [Pseudomonas oleovorans]UZZ09019.1 hypothetical protein NDO41_16620 [Pseudomonas mendocina]WGG19642.1 hypothetical protein N5O83_14295 [Pseudomonas oleovorans]
MSSSIEQQIRDLAAAGYSRRHTMELLGYTLFSFETVLDLIGPVDWPGPNQSLSAKLASEMRRGKFTKGMARSQALAAIAKREKYAKTVRGVTGSIEELITAFGLSIGASTVRRRMHAGMDLESALFTPRCATNNLGKHLGAHTMSDEKWQQRQKGAAA